MMTNTLCPEWTIIPIHALCHRRFQRWIEEGVLGSVREALALDLQERVQIDFSAIKGWRRAVRIRKTLEERRCGAGSLALAERPVPLAQ
jgi:hypothetical protein